MTGLVLSSMMLVLSKLSTTKIKAYNLPVKWRLSQMRAYSLLLINLLAFPFCGIIVCLLGELLSKVSHFRYNPSISCPYECGFFPFKTPATYSIGF